LDAANNNLSIAQEGFGLNRYFVFQCDAIEHLIQVCYLRKADKEATKWQRQLEDIQIQHNIPEKGKVRLETILVTLVLILTFSLTGVHHCFEDNRSRFDPVAEGPRYGYDQGPR